MAKLRHFEKTPCNRCRHETKHLVIAEHTTRDSEGDGEADDCTPYWITTYQMLQCMGCDSVVLKRSVWFSEVEGVSVAFFPPRISRELPVWRAKLAHNERALLEETYTALQAGSSRLAIMGARALVDMLMTREVGDIGGFSEKLEALKCKGIVSEVNARVLKAALEMGHAVAHRGHPANDEDVSAVFDIVENVLQSSVLKNIAETLATSTPKRRRLRHSTGRSQP